MNITKSYKDPYVKDVSYEIFMLLLSILAVFNIILYFLIPINDIKEIFGVMGGFIGVFFLFDFLYRFFTVPSKKVYLINKFGWADLLASIPLVQFNIFRILRIVKVVVIINRIGAKNLYNLLSKELANTALFGVFFVMILVIEFGAMGILYAEKNALDANIITAKDALWWAFVSITTVGYGDKFPTTDLGRIVGVVTIFVGVGLFGVVTGFLANKFVVDKK
jgi:voltage-gated potassium channel